MLGQQTWQHNAYQIVPIRMEDRYKIMEWRNEQMYHLRQNKKLTKDDQDHYFEKVVYPLFELEQPEQLLFSYLQEDQCIGYGSLVHINWHDRNAEISFIVQTALEKDAFAFHWSTYLAMIEQVAFKELSLHKIFTFAIDLRPQLYPMLKVSGFSEEAVLKEHVFFNGSYIDVRLHHKINPNG